MTHDQTESLCQFVTKTQYYYQANNGFYPPPDCQCELIAKVREDTLAKCIAALKELESDMANWSSDETRAVTDVVPDLTFDQWVWAQRGVGRSAQVLRALEEKP